jgi:hypothetical protein
MRSYDKTSDNDEDQRGRVPKVRAEYLFRAQGEFAFELTNESRRDSEQNHER